MSHTDSASNHDEEEVMVEGDFEDDMIYLDDDEIEAMDNDDEDDGDDFQTIN